MAWNSIIPKKGGYILIEIENDLIMENGSKIMVDGMGFSQGKQLEGQGESYKGQQTRNTSNNYGGGGGARRSSTRHWDPGAG